MELRMKAARVVSILLHPFVVLATLALVAAWTLDPTNLPRTAAGVGVVVAVVWLFVLQRRRSGRWETMDASRSQERPLLYVLLLALTAGYWVWMGGATNATSTGILVMVGMLCIAGLFNRWIKLSLHMASLVFAGVAMLGLMPRLGVVLLLLVPVLAWSRLEMRRHDMAEVVGGSVLGALAGALLSALG